MPATYTPVQTLRFGSFGLPFSAPPRLCGDRVESGDAYEHVLPPILMALLLVEESPTVELRDVSSQ